MAALKGSKTEENLKAAFAGESQANRRYLYFANKADVEGQNDVAALFRSTAEGETGHAHGHLEWLEQCGDPATGLPIGATRDNLKAAVAGETHEYTDMYPGMAKTARQEGHDEIADWFETLAKAERSHANRYTRALNELGDCPVHGHPRRKPRSAHPSPDRLEDRGVLRRGGGLRGTGTDLRHLPRLPPLRRPVRCIPHALRPRRREFDRGGRWRAEGRLLEGGR